jgi:hypothetical protein
MENRPVAVATWSTSRLHNADLPSRQRARRTNDVFAGGLSKNTSAGRRVADLLRAFLRAMGDPTDAVLQSNALRAAELTVATETARAKLLAGDGDIDAVVRIEGMAARSVRALGIKSTTSGPAPAESFGVIAARAQAAADVRRAAELAADAEDDDQAEAAGNPRSRPAGRMP